jgi:hypothetical protein
MNDTPQVLIFSNYLENEEWKKIKNYTEEMSEQFGYLGSGDSPVRFKKVKHSRLPHIEYERCFMLSQDEYESILRKERDEPYPESMGNETDWKALTHSPSTTAISELLLKTIHKSQSIISNIFGHRTVWEFGPFITMYGEGKSLRVHCDGYQYGLPGYPQTDYSTVYYINDDYEGGEYILPALGLTYRPVANSLLMISNSSHEDMAHGVAPVTAGKRYTCSGFFTVDNG